MARSEGIDVSNHDGPNADRAQDIFIRALDHDLATREAFLRSECGDDDPLLAEVRSLLDAHESAGGFMHMATVEPDPHAVYSTAMVAPGQRIGQYTIRRVIATGGMGVVCEAIQERPHRTVALKLMKSGLSSRSAQRRFETESQILARLRHPNIAQVYEAGIHIGGGEVPFFAMEYIPGAKTLVEYAQSQQLDIRARLELYVKICDAVHHGHRKGIIHRDLKPGNILIDSTGEPKIIDFGVARATDADLALTTLQTAVGQLIGTLQYMSPEQCDADPHVIDVRSDVYSLGVVLYELLCDQLPYDLHRLALHEATRVIREVEPPKPSSFNRVLRGDIEVIALTALEKQPEHRYQSADRLAEDIESYLADKPLQHASRRGIVRHITRATRRHRRAVSGAAFVAMTLAISIFIAIYESEPSARLTITVRPSESAEILDDAEVYIRRIDTESRLVGDLIPLGSAPLERVAVPIGYYRIVVATPDRLWETVEYFDDDQAYRHAAVLRPAADVTRDMVLIESLAASVGQKTPLPFMDAKPRTVTLPAFWVDPHEVTQREYKTFVEATDRDPPAIWENGYPLGSDDLPMVGITWDDARAYAAWAGKRLLSDIEWERAGRGTDGRTRPWGTDPRSDEACAVIGRRTSDGAPAGGAYTAEQLDEFVAAVHPSVRLDAELIDESPAGVLHMFGNVAEWTETLVFRRTDDGVEIMDGYRIIKGDHWGTPSKERCSLAGLRLHPVESGGLGFGFRCARSVQPVLEK